MADNDTLKDSADYGLGIPVRKHAFFLKGLDRPGLFYTAGRFFIALVPLI